MFGNLNPTFLSCASLVRFCFLQFTSYVSDCTMQIITYFSFNFPSVLLFLLHVFPWHSITHYRFVYFFCYFSPMAENSTLLKYYFAASSVSGCVFWVCLFMIFNFFLFVALTTWKQTGKQK